VFPAQQSRAFHRTPPALMYDFANAQHGAWKGSELMMCGQMMQTIPPHTLVRTRAARGLLLIVGTSLLPTAVAARAAADL
jgi:hypothetical protein